MSINKLTSLTEEELNNIQHTVGNAFAANELFHNWGSLEERYEDALVYMKHYVNFLYEAGWLYGNEAHTAIIGISDSGEDRSDLYCQMKRNLERDLSPARLQSVQDFLDQIKAANARYASGPHLEGLIVVVDGSCRGQGLAKALIEKAKQLAEEKGIPVLFKTDMPSYVKMYTNRGCRQYNQVTADNGVTRYCFIYQPEKER